MTRPTLSVGIPNYNHSKYIGEALESVLTQKVPPDEVIVVDDASTDDSVQVIEGFVRRYPNVRLIRNETNRGALASVNSALAEASSEYWFQLSADDKVLPGFVERTLGALEHHPGAGMCVVALKHLDADGNPVRWENFPSFHTHEAHAGSEGYLSPSDVHARLRRQPWFLGGMANVVVRRDALREAGGMQPEFGSSADWFATHYIAFKYGLVYLAEPLAAFRLVPNSFGTANALQPSRMLEMNARMFRKMKEPPYSAVFPSAFIEEQAKIFTYIALRTPLMHWNTSFAAEVKASAPPGSALSKALLRLLRFTSGLQLFILKRYCWRNVALALRENRGG